jgi:Domain of unknown function (DUF1840)
MMYKFKSKAAGDVIMLGPNGDQVMRLLGREPADKGIFEAAALPAAAAALEAAVVAEEAMRRQAADDNDDKPGKGDGVSLRQRVWPLVEMMKRSHAEGQPIVWGT